MDTTKMSSKGQVVLPKAVRDALKWRAGVDLSVERGDDFVVLRRAAVFPRRTVDDVAGCLTHEGPPVSLEDMEKAIDDELAERWRRKSR